MALFCAADTIIVRRQLILRPARPMIHLDGA